jgi:hypothetical protein
MSGQDGEFYDLRNFFHAIGSFSASRALTEAPAVRLDCDVPVELLDPDPVLVTAAPLEVDGFVDGIQSAVCVSYRSHRPVYLTYVAAGAASVDGRLVALREKLNVVVSHLEHDWLRDLDVAIPSVELPQDRPDELAGAALANLAGDRETLERVVVDEMLARPGRSIVVDGGLVGRPIRDRVVGVVKTVQRRYLPDESVLFGLPVGWRSPRFLIPAGSQGVSVPRYSCYVRLHDASRMAWNFGLVRLEAFKPELLDPLCALALVERQPAGSHDRRFDRHLSGVRAVEDLLRARRPTVFAS